MTARNRNDNDAFVRRLERRAERIVKTASPRGSPTLRGIVDEIALTLDQLRRARAVHERFSDELSESEQRIRNNILQLTPPTMYRDPFCEERAEARERLARIHTEQRRVAVSELQNVNPLHERLLTVISRHRQIAAFHESRTTRAKA